MVSKIRNKYGLTLIELLLSLAILGIIIISISSLLANVIRINKISNQQYKATLLAQSYMEEIKASSDINIGQTIEFYEDTRIIIEISETSKYPENIYIIILEVVVDENVLERLEGYKIFTQ